MMNVGDFFWLLMLVWLIFGGWGAYQSPAGNVRISSFGGHILVWLIVACFGFHFFGFPLHG